MGWRTILVFALACGSGGSDEGDGGGRDAAGRDSAVTDAGGRDSGLQDAGRTDAARDAADLPPPGECIVPGSTPRYEGDALSADRVVTSTADSGAGSLREALEDAPDGVVIGFDPSLAGETIELDNELTVSAANATIDGRDAPGITLDGRSRVRVISVDKNRSFTMIGLRIINGRADAGAGGLRLRQADEGRPEQHARVLGCVFEGNHGPRAGALSAGWRVHLEVTDSVFRNNDGTRGDDRTRPFSGGAISTAQSASLRIARSVFEGNRGYKSGAVYNILQPIEIIDSAFFNNEAVDGSGAIFTDGGNPAGPRNESFEGSIEVTRTWIERNRGQKAGGAMLLWGYPGDEITLDGVTMLDNACAEDADGESKGGAARIQGKETITIRRSYFGRSRSEQQGGALWIDGPGELRIEMSTFVENTTRGLGGAFVFNGRDGSLRVESSAFVRNEAGNACGAFFWASRDTDVFVQNTFFVENTADDLTSRHVRMPFPTDGGGNLEWATERPDRGRVFDEGVFADPLLGEVQPMGCSLGILGSESSPLLGGGVRGADQDAAGASRDNPPDIGPFEH
ncbi:MAG: hypothetical protein AAGE52_05300 [Myxococcota bacterium]